MQSGTKKKKQVKQDKRKTGIVYKYRSAILKHFLSGVALGWTKTRTYFNFICTL